VSGGPVRVPVDVFEGIEAVRRSGHTNMLDGARVAELAEEMGHHRAAAWIRAHPGLHSQAVFEGFVPRAEGECPPGDRAAPPERPATGMDAGGEPESP